MRHACEMNTLALDEGGTHLFGVAVNKQGVVPEQIRNLLEHGIACLSSAVAAVPRAPVGVVRVINDATP